MSDGSSPPPASLSCRDRLFSHAGYTLFKKWIIRLAVGYTIFSVVAAVLTGIILLVLRFGVTPKIKAYVEDARLDSFGFFNATPSVGMTTSFACNISVAFTVRNPNLAMKIEYTKPLVATFLFYDRRLYNVSVVDEGHKHTPRKRERHLLHTGEMVPQNVLDTAAVQEFKKQNATGVFELEMRLSGGISVGIGNKRELALSCPLRLQVSPPGPEVVLFHEVTCKPDEPDKIYF